jgi:catechol 2,3-dioxygenase-like lactoylglutathione lyase family enzyme
MRATRLNHVSVSANDLEESARFYEELFGMERVPTAKFQGAVLWLRCGENQLHLFLREADAPRFHHLALDVDDFEAVYLKAKELGALDFETHGAAIRAHPSGWVQMYLRDPAGNLVEVDWPDADGVDRSVVTDWRNLEEQVPQTGEAAVATLYTAGVPS